MPMTEKGARMSADVLKQGQDSMAKALEHLKKELRHIRTGRAAPLLVENLQVVAYGGQNPMKACGTISVPEARQLLIKPHDPTLLKEIEKAILASDLGVTPQNDGKAIRITFPPLSGERRQKLAQEAKAKGEEAKVSLRNVRRDAIKALEDLERKSKISEDELKKRKDDIQAKLKDAEKAVDAEVAKKTAEIMEI